MRNTSRRRLCIDIDNVVALSDRVMRALIEQHSTERVALLYEEVVEFDYRRCADSRGRRISDEDWQRVHEVHFSSASSIALIEPYPGVQQHLQMLAVRYELHLVTSRLAPARSATVEWLEKHAFPPHRLHFVHHGEKHEVLADFAAAVEDDPVQADAFALKGTKSFLMAHPWNVHHHPDVIRVRSWDELLVHLSEF